MKKRTKAKRQWKPIKAWALCDPETGYVNGRYITETRHCNGGRGSITEGWVPVKVEIRQAR